MFALTPSKIIIRYKNRRAVLDTEFHIKKMNKTRIIRNKMQKFAFISFVQKFIAVFSRTDVAIKLTLFKWALWNTETATDFLLLLQLENVGKKEQILSQNKSFSLNTFHMATCLQIRKLYDVVANNRFILLIMYVDILTYSIFNVRMRLVGKWRGSLCCI